MSETLRVGTRGSKLALVQAEAVRSILESRFPGLEVEIRTIKTRGDRILDAPLSKIGGKGLFIREIEDALRRGRIDVAVHSLKDLPTLLPAELALGGVLVREDPRDALVSLGGRRLADLGAGDRIGTSSLRRRAQLLAVKPGLQVVEVRGNVDTRLAKLGQGRFDALVLAASGLKRAGAEAQIVELLAPELMLPAVCQGIIGMEMRREDTRTAGLIGAVSDPVTFEIASAERVFLHRLEGGCQVPVGCLAAIDGGAGAVTGMVASLDGRRVVRRSRRGPAAKLGQLAESLAADILEAGGGQILGSIRSYAGR
jgi:hydroxymethylbilane synthase